MSSSRAFSSMPILARSVVRIGVMSTCGGLLRLMNRTFLQAGASQTPSPLVSYWVACFISCLGLGPIDPALPGVAYGS